jgi:hypothetical protein
MWHRVRVFCFVPTCFEKCAILTSRVVFLQRIVESEEVAPYRRADCP